MEWQSIIGPAVGALGVIVAAWFGLRGARRTDQTAGLDKAASWWKEAVEHLQQDVATLKADRAEVKAEYEKLRDEFSALKDSNDALARENRLFREVLIGVMSRLQELTHDTGRPILDYIIERIPGLGKDK